MVFPGHRIDGKQTINGARGLYKTGRCNPSVTLLARELSVSHDTVQRAINTLEAEGFLTRVSATGQRNVYDFPGLTHGGV